MLLKEKKKEKKEKGKKRNDPNRGSYNLLDTDTCQHVVSSHTPSYSTYGAFGIEVHIRVQIQSINPIASHHIASYSVPVPALRIRSSQSATGSVVLKTRK